MSTVTAIVCDDCDAVGWKQRPIAATGDQVSAARDVLRARGWTRRDVRTDPDPYYRRLDFCPACSLDGDGHA